MTQDSLTADQTPSEHDALLLRIQELEERCRRAEDALHAFEERNRLIGESAPFGILVADTEGRAFGANRKFLDMLAWPADANIEGLNVFEDPAFVESGVAEAFRRCIDERTSVTSDHPCLPAQAECSHQRYHLSPVLDSDGRLSGIIAFVEDVTELKQAEEIIKASEKRYRLLFESAPVAMVERDAAGLKQYLERLRADGIADLRRYLNQNPQEVVHCMGMIKTVNCNRAFLDLMEARTPEEVESGFRLSNNQEDFLRMAQDTILMVAEGNVSAEREETFLTLKGTRRSVLGKSLPLSGHEDTLARIVISIVDITRRKQAEEALRASEQRFREQAMRDNLTGLYNRRYLYQSLSDLIERSKTNGSVLSVLFMDLDRFKAVVDTYGHLNGSRTIREIADTIRANLPHPAYAVAYAGDEFVVVLPGFDQSQAVQQAKQIQTAIKEQGFLRGLGLEVKIQASFGIATFPDHADNLTDLLAAADHALFGAKGAGKDSINSAGNVGS